jgi:hypothetical protein
MVPGSSLLVLEAAGYCTDMEGRSSGNRRTGLRRRIVLRDGFELLDELVDDLNNPINGGNLGLVADSLRRKRCRGWE